MKVLVTGAAGFIGSHLCERLLRSGHEVVGVDNFDTFYEPTTKVRNLRVARGFSSFSELRADIRDEHTYARLPDDIEAVIHLAARAGVRPSIDDPGLYLDVNLNGTLRLLEYMRAAGVPRLLFGSSSSVYGDDSPVPFSETSHCARPISPYAATKRAGELLVHSHGHLFGIDALCLRFFTVYGPRQRPDLAIHKFARLMVGEEEIPVFGDGSSERDYTEVQDIVSGVERALDYLVEHPGTYDVVNLGGARTTSLSSMIEQLSDALAIPARVQRLPSQPGDVRRTYADVTKAGRLFGYEPTTPFEVGVRDFAAWFLAERMPARRMAIV